jgi:hypothetical protein
LLLPENSHMWGDLITTISKYCQNIFFQSLIYREAVLCNIFFRSLQTTLCLCTVATNRSLLDLDRGASSFRGWGSCTLCFSFCLLTDLSCLIQLEQEMLPQSN